MLAIYNLKKEDHKNQEAIDKSIKQIENWLRGKHSKAKPLTSLIEYCEQVFLAEYAKAPKPPVVNIKTVGGDEERAALAKRWNMKVDDAKFLAAMANQKSFNFMSGLSAQNRRLVSARLIREAPNAAGQKLAQLIRLEDFDTMVPADLELIKKQWELDAQTLAIASATNQGRYHERLNAAVATKDAYEYFSSLSKDERIWGSNNSFKKRARPLETEVAKLRSADEQAAAAASQSAKKKAAKERTKSAQNQKIEQWERIESEILASTRSQVQQAGFTDENWLPGAQDILAANRSSLAKNTTTDLRASVEDLIRLHLISHYLHLKQRNFPQLTEPVRDTIRNDPTIGITDFGRVLQEAWNHQRSPQHSQIWADWMGLTLQSDDSQVMEQFNRLPNVGPLGAHYSLKLAAISQATVGTNTTPTQLVDQLINPAGKAQNVQVHATLETGVRLAVGQPPGRGNYRLPHKYANGEYGVYFLDPPPPGNPRFNRWDGAPYIPGTPRETEIRAALDVAYLAMRADLERRASYILTNGSGPEH